MHLPKGRPPVIDLDFERGFRLPILAAWGLTGRAVLRITRGV
jgi:hypothetical protein